MKEKLFKTIFMSFVATFAANAQNFQQRIADIDEKAVELQRRLHDNELRLQRHAEIMEQAQLRLKALQAGQALPPKSKIPSAPPEPTESLKNPPVLPPPSPPATQPSPNQLPLSSQVRERRPPRIVPNIEQRGSRRNYYFQIFSGFVIPGSVDIPKDGGTADYDNGYLIGAGAGIDFGHFRLGMELAQRSYDDERSDWGHAEANSFMANLGWEWDYWQSNVFYLGLGIGPSLAKIQRPSKKHSFKETLFAYQLSTGLGYRFSDNLSGRLGYKYFSTSNATDFERLDSHAIEAFLEFDL